MAERAPGGKARNLLEGNRDGPLERERFGETGAENERGTNVAEAETKEEVGGPPDALRLLPQRSTFPGRVALATPGEVAGLAEVAAVRRFGRRHGRRNERR